VTDHRAPGGAWFQRPILQTLALDAALAEAVPALRAAGIEPLLLKGPAIAHWLHDDPNERAYGDVDLLVPVAAISRARDTLLALGYDEPFADSRSEEQAQHAATFVRGPVAVDLHWELDLMPHPDAYRLLGRGAAPLQVAGVEVLAPPPAALVVIVALHAAQHGHTATPATADLRRAIARVDIETWRDAARLAREAGVISALRAGLGTVDGGDRLAAMLELPDQVPVGLRMRSESLRGVNRIEALLAATGWRRRLGLLMSTLFPSPAFMRYVDPRARRGRLALLTAYAMRLPRLAAQVSQTVLRYARVRRASRRQAMVVSRSDQSAGGAPASGAQVMAPGSFSHSRQSVTCEATRVRRAPPWGSRPAMDGGESDDIEAEIDDERDRPEPQPRPQHLDVEDESDATSAVPPATTPPMPSE